MEYNTSLPHLIIPEYGRNIQKMIDFAKTVKDRQERNKVAQSIIDVMGALNPHLRDITDFKHKLWDHLFIISGFKLDVDSPYPMPTAATFQTKPDRIKIPSQKIRYKHYGKITEDVIDKASQYPEGAEKEVLAEVIANLMKRSYLTWNRDTVSDSTILAQMEELSKGRLVLKDHLALKSTQSFVPRTQNQNPINKKPGTPGFRPKNNGGNSGNAGNSGNNPNNKFRKKF